ncbi:MAG: HEAT repeat domain-containing protein [Planctomycetes bacterium]|nr:HEAT repeat domain-containing protein [Planctomycetota bacterium]
MHCAFLLPFLLSTVVAMPQDTQTPRPGPVSDDEIVETIGRLSIDDPKAFPYTVQRLAGFGTRAIPHCVRVVRDPGYAAQVRNGCMQALAVLGPASLPALEAVTASLDDELALLRARAIEVIGAIGLDARSALPAVEKKLKDDDAFVRSRALIVMALITEDRAAFLPRVVNALEDPSPIVRAMAASAIQQFYAGAAKDYVDRIAEHIDAKDATVKRHACLALASQGDAAVPLLLEFVRAKEDPKASAEDNARTRARKFSAIQIFGLLRPVRPEGVDALVDTFRHADKKLVDAAADSLRRIGGEAVGRIASVAADESLPFARRIRAITELGTIGDPSRAYASVLVDALQHDHPKMREAASLAVTKIVSGVPGSIEALRKLLDDPSIETRMNAAQALGQAGKAAKPALEALVAMLSADPRAARAAAHALMKLGADAAPVVPRLIALLDTGDTGVRLRTVEILGSMGELVVPALLESAKSVDSLRSRRCIALVMQQIGAHLSNGAEGAKLATQCVTVLQAWLDSGKDVLVRDSAIALGQLGARAKSVVPRLIRLVKDGAIEERIAALIALSRIDPLEDRVFETIHAAVSSESQDVRWAALESLGTPGNAKALPILIATLESTVEVDRIRAAESLSRIGKPAKEAIPALQKAARRELQRPVADTLNGVIRILMEL